MTLVTKLLVCHAKYVSSRHFSELNKIHSIQSTKQKTTHFWTTLAEWGIRQRFLLHVHKVKLSQVGPNNLVGVYKYYLLNTEWKQDVEKKNL